MKDLSKAETAIWVRSCRRVVPDSRERHPDYVAPRRRYSRGAYFKRDELALLSARRYRTPRNPLAACEIAAAIIAVKGNFRTPPICRSRR